LEDIFMLDERNPMGHHAGTHGMTNEQKRPKGHDAAGYAEGLKGRHLERAAHIHEMQKGKMSGHGVLMEASPESMHVNLEAAYKAHHEGQEFGNVLHAMSTPHELQMLHSARRQESTAQDINMPHEVYNEKI
jgi:hypothetical protein